MNPIRTSAQRCMIAFTPPVQCVSVNGRQPLCNRWEEALHFCSNLETCSSTRGSCLSARSIYSQASLSAATATSCGSVCFGFGMEFIWRTLVRPTSPQEGRPSDFHEADELPSFDQSMAAVESIGLLTATVLRGARLRKRGATDRNTHSWRTRFAFCPFRTSAHLDRGTPS